MDKSSTASS